MNERAAAFTLMTSFAVVALVSIPSAFADKEGNPGGGKGNGGGNAGAADTSTTQGSTTPNGSSGCTQNAPSVTVDNNWAWGSSGSWGMPGQQLLYSIRVMNNDSRCAASSFVVNLTAPDGFSVAMPTTTVSLKSASSAHLSAYVTSPAASADGSYVLSVGAQRAAGGDASGTSYYKVYSSDAAAPTLFWENPWAGQAISGRSFNVTVASSDDHAVKKIDVYIDGAYKSTKACDDVTYICQLYYKWSTRGVHGQHTVTFVSTDWMGNAATLTSTVTVN